MCVYCYLTHSQLSADTASCQQIWTEEATQKHADYKCKPPAILVWLTLVHHIPTVKDVSTLWSPNPLWNWQMATTFPPPLIPPPHPHPLFLINGGPTVEIKSMKKTTVSNTFIGPAQWRGQADLPLTGPASWHQRLGHWLDHRITATPHAQWQ